MDPTSVASRTAAPAQPSVPPTSRTASVRARCSCRPEGSDIGGEVPAEVPAIAPPTTTANSGPPSPGSGTGSRATSRVRSAGCPTVVRRALDVDMASICPMARVAQGRSGPSLTIRTTAHPCDHHPAVPRHPGPEPSRRPVRPVPRPPHRRGHGGHAVARTWGRPGPALACGRAHTLRWGAAPHRSKGRRCPARPRSTRSPTPSARRSRASPGHHRRQPRCDGCALRRPGGARRLRAGHPLDVCRVRRRGRPARPGLHGGRARQG